MTDALINVEAVPGHNAPPEPTPFERVAQRIDDLYGEGRNWLDGKPIENQDQNDAVATIVREMQAAAAEADKLRTAEKKPYDEAANAVQERFHPLIGNTKAGKGKSVRVIDGCKALLTAFMVAEDAKKRAAADVLRREAEERERIAREAMQASSVDDLAKRERAEQLVKAAETAKRDAAKAEKDRPVARSGGRAMSLRLYHDATLVDSAAALKHAKAAWADDLKAWLVQRAQQDMNRGVLTIPGFDAVERRSVA